MDFPKRALLLVGSPKASESTSAALGTYLLGKLQGNFDGQEAYIQTLMRTPEGQVAMLELVKASDLLVLAFPLYVDSLPAAVISALGLIAQQRKSADTPRSQKLVAIVNNGFPEAAQNNTALAICRRFCTETGIDWAGGLSLGGGGAISGKPLSEAGFLARNVKKSLDLAAACLLDGKPVSQEAVDLMAKPAVPRWLYLMMSNRGFRQLAKANGAEKQLSNLPQEEKQ